MCDGIEAAGGSPCPRDPPADPALAAVTVAVEGVAEVPGLGDKLPLTVVLRVQRFVRREVIDRAYRRAQIQARGLRAFRLRPGAVLQERALRLFDFVEVKRRPGVTFEMLRQWWNRQVRVEGMPALFEYGTYRLLWSHYLQTRERLLGPS